MRVNAKSEYALRAMVDLVSRTENLTTLDEIARRQSIPASILPSIMQTLAKAGLVETVRGYGGGARLGRPPEEIKVHMVLEAMEGPLELYRCRSLEGPCPLGLGRHCPLRGLWEQTQALMLDLWAKTSLADLAKSHRLPDETPTRYPQAGGSGLPATEGA